MSLYGYARVSTLDQDLAIQHSALRAAGCEVIRAEKASGTRRDGRTELQVLLDFVRAGDTLVVTRIDRLARSLKDLQDIVHELKAKGVALKATEQPVDTGTAAGKAFLDMLGRVRRVRDQSAPRASVGRDQCRQGARRLQRPPAVDRCRGGHALAPGGKARATAAIARRLGIGRASVYRLLGKQAAVAASGGVDADQA